MQDEPEPFEVIICDDGSNAENLQVVRECCRKHSVDLKYIWQPDTGFRLARSRNNGIRIAKGDLFVFIDGDILVHSNFLRDHREAHSDEKNIVCGSRRWGKISSKYYSMMPYERDLFYRQIRNLVQLLPAHERDRHKWCSSQYPWLAFLACNFSVKSSHLMTFDEGFVGWGFEDTEFAFRLMHTHKYSLTYRKDLECIHLVMDGSLPSQNPLLSFQTADLAALIRNAIHLASLHSPSDLGPVFDILKLCTLDPLTDEWRLVQTQQDKQIDNLLSIAQAWVNRLDETRSRNLTLRTQLFRSHLGPIVK